MTVSGGVPTLLYSFTGSTQRTTGNLKLPVREQQRYEKFYGPIPDYFIRPDRYTTLGGSGQITAKPTSTISVTWSSTLYHSHQQRSSLEDAIQQLQGIYIDSTQLASTGLIDGEYERATDQSLSAINRLTLDWQALSWLRLQGTGGLNTTQRTDVTYIPFGVNSARPASPDGDTTGSYGLGKGTAQALTFTMGTVIPMKFVRTAIGVNYTSQSTADVSAYTSQLAPGVTQPTAFPTGVVDGRVPSSFGQSVTTASTYGWYIQPTLNFHSRFFASPGFRLDGGSASGTQAGLTGFPKIDFSYLAVDPDHAVGILTLFRPRLALGYAGTQPSPADRLRLFNLDATGRAVGTSLVSLDGGMTQVPIVQLSTLGNSELRPERTGEIEGGLDADFGNNRLQTTLTFYSKTRYDAIISFPVPPSVTGEATNISKNIGVVRNTGIEMTVSTRLLDRRELSWTINGNLSSDNNKVLRLNPGISNTLNLQPNSAVSGSGTYIAVGYPLGGVWTRPIVSYFDANHDGIIEREEMRLGDSAAFMGQTEPKYQFNVSTSVGLWNGRLNITANLSYQNGVTQSLGGRGFQNNVLINVPNEPGTSLATQAAVIASTYGVTDVGVMQTVNTLRFNSLSINSIMPAAVSKLLHVPTMTIAVQGKNLGLHTNYRGADPNVNTYSTSNGGALLDTGQIPQPRTWSLTFRMGN
jgi:outer membrane receptor protein involved in Fe transport